MIKKVALFSLVMVFSCSGAERGYHQLTNDTPYYADSDDAVSNELGALENGNPTDVNFEDELVKKALFQHIYRSSKKQEKYKQMMQDQPEGYKLLVTIMQAQLQPKRTQPTEEPFDKTPARVRTAESIRFDEATTAAIQKTLKQYHLEKSYHELKSLLELSRLSEQELREKLMSEKKKSHDRKKEIRKLKKELEKLKGSDQKK